VEIGLVRFDEPRERLIIQPSSEIEVSCSHDYAAIRALCLHPCIFPKISDDYTSDPAKWEIPQSESIIYLLASDGDGAFGFGIFIPETHAQYTAHFGFLPRSYGAEARKAFEKMLAWMWTNSTASRIVGEIVKSNTLAIRFVRQCGFEPYGINRRSYLRGGVLQDQVCLGISRPELT